MTDRRTDKASGSSSRLLRQPWFVGCLTFVLSLASFLQAASSRGVLHASPLDGGDEDSYERLGFNIAAGLGFGYCPSDMPVVMGLSEPPPTATCTAGCTRAEFWPTAYRPPGFPLMVAAVYRVSPLNYFAVRVINCLCCAIAVALAAAWFCREFSLATGLMAGGLCCVDPRFREFAGTFLTENPATLLLTLFAISFSSLVSRRSVVNAGFCGLSFSALVCVRSFFVTWYPVLWIVVAVSLSRQARRSQTPWITVVKPLSVFCLASLVLTAPWWIRNCLALGAFMPAGTQGGILIADGFSDSAYANFGSWAPGAAYEIAAEMKQNPTLQGLTPIEFEREHAIQGVARAKAWIREHPQLMPQLAFWKFGRLWEFGSIRHAALFGCLFVGLFAARAHPMSRVLFLLLVLNSVTVMATYHTYERFMTPFRPMIHGMVACGLIWIVSRIRQVIVPQRQPIREAGNCTR